MPDALLVSSSFLPGRGGIESYLAELCDRLAPRLAVLAPAVRDKKPIPQDLGYPASGYPGSMLWPTKKIARAIVESARRHRAGKVLFGTPWPLVLLGPEIKKAGLAYAVIVHGAELLVPAAVPVVKARLASALAGADLLLPVSRYTESKLTAFLSESGLEVPTSAVLRAAIDIDRFSPHADGAAARRKLDVEDSRPVVLAFGRLVRRKGVDRLVKIMPQVRQAVPRAILVVAGTGPELLPLKRLAHRKKAPVIFTGRVPEEEAPALYAAADVFALPVADRWFGLEIEGLGVVLLEAAATETPCLTGRSGGTPEAVIDGRTGFVVDARDEKVLLDRLLLLLRDRDKAAEMGRAGREHVAEHFSGRNLPESLVHWLEEGRDAHTDRSDD
jgi:phosphatidylinositol alpha-1,6-mannosyltransferase